MEMFDIDDHIIARTFMAPTKTNTITPGMKGVIIEREEAIKRHKILFENGKEFWATSAQVKLDPEFPKQEKTAEPSE